MDGVTYTKRPAKRAKVEEDRPFKVDLAEKHPDLPALAKRLRAAGAGGAATITDTYAIPIAAIGKELYVDTRTALRTKPKPTYNRGQRTDKPWDLTKTEDGVLHLPRALGYMLCGAAGTVEVVDRPVVYPRPVYELLDAEAAAAMFKSDQVTAVTKLIVDLKAGAAGPAGFGAAMYCIPTGHGKGASSIHAAALLGQRFLYIATSESLFDQFEKEFKLFLGPDLVVGRMWTSDHRKWKNVDADVVLTTVSSAASCDIPIDEFGFVVVDESHLACTAKRKDLYFRIKAKYLMLMTATPERPDLCGAYQQWLGGPVSTYIRIDFRNNRWGGFDVVTQPIKYDRPIRETFERGRDGVNYTKIDALFATTMHHRGRNAAIVRRIAEYVRVQKRNFVLVGVRVWHVETIARLLNEAGVETGVLVGKHSDGRVQKAEERAVELAKPNLVAYMSLGAQALNIPRLDSFGYISGGCAWHNDTFLVQAFGRIARDVKEGKNKPMILLFEDETAPKGYFAKQVTKTKAKIKGLGDGFDFVTADPITLK